ncbi:hypothetical protein BVAD3_37660 [Bacillus velezensis]|nr:hypothetical protein BVAD3_37660 [Bacillus velezensis]
MQFKEIKLEELNSNAWSPGGVLWSAAVVTAAVGAGIVIT